jgi:deoxycytidine triphosphate deaminase
MQPQLQEKGTPVAKILPDREIRKMLGTVIVNADESRINPNGLEIRMGSRVFFQSTEEEKELSPGMYLKVMPGETVTISSFETFNLKREVIHKVFPDCDLMALITPTTTMMREGMMQTATKVDSGWKGTLNWGVRNSSIKDFIIGYGEPIFKLTFFLLEGSETPEILYGERADDKYQDANGITRSKRTIPANIPKKNIIGSSIEQLDPKRQLKEAGYPFSHISTELTDLHGKFEIVSKDVLLLKEAISDETKKLSAKVEDAQRTVLERVESLFDKKFFGAVGWAIGGISIMYGVVVFLQGQGLSSRTIGAMAVVAGLAVWGILRHLHSQKSSQR